MNNQDAEHSYIPHPEDESVFQPQSFNTFDIYRQAKQQPEQFWSERREAIRQGLRRPEFVDKSQAATVGIVIPAHNETLGKKDGNLQSCLFAISQLTIPEGVTVKIMVIGHNNDQQDRSSQLLDEVSPKIEYLPYDTELRGFSYPLQAAGLVWQPSEVREVGVIDADTVVNPNWLTAMQTALHSKESVGAVAGPRGYLDAQGNVMAYGRVKNLIEKTLRSVGAKLVSGNSFYDAQTLHEAVAQRVGTMMTDGDLQTEITRAGHEVVAAADAHAASDGEKFVELPALALVFQKARTMLRPGVDDHLRFAMQELPSYFPDFRHLIEQIKAENNIGDDFIGTASQQEKSELLAFLEQQIAMFNAENRQVMLHDIARLVAQRPQITQ
jgi:hypothetical protein